MKNLLIFNLLMSFSYLSSSQVPIDYVKVKGTFYISKYEVSNSDYKKYLTYLVQTEQVKLYLQSIPDTNLWLKINAPYVSNYFSYPNYSNYPLVGITYENAVGYCRWLSEEYNSNKKRKHKKVLFRLPTDEEWKYAANGGDNNKIYSWDFPYLIDRKKGYMCNFLRLGDNVIAYDDTLKTYGVKYLKYPDPADKAAIPGPIRNYSPNQFGIYNMCGNVAEMVQEKGIAKGGSYSDPGYDVRIASIKKYTSSSVQIGFRVAMEILVE